MLAFHFPPGSNPLPVLATPPALGFFTSKRRTSRMVEKAKRRPAGQGTFSVSGYILVAVHEKNELVSIDPTTAKIIGRYPVTGIEHPHGVSLDVPERLAFIAGEENHKLAVVDLTSMKV